MPRRDDAVHDGGPGRAFADIAAARDWLTTRRVHRQDRRDRFVWARVPCSPPARASMWQRPTTGRSPAMTPPWRVPAGGRSYAVRTDRSSTPQPSWKPPSRVRDRPDVEEYPPQGMRFLNDAESGPRCCARCSDRRSATRAASAADAWRRIDAFLPTSPVSRGAHDSTRPASQNA